MKIQLKAHMDVAMVHRVIWAGRRRGMRRGGVFPLMFCRGKSESVPGMMGLMRVDPHLGR